MLLRPPSTSHILLSTTVPPGITSLESTERDSTQIACRAGQGKSLTNQPGFVIASWGALGKSDSFAVKCGDGINYLWGFHGSFCFAAVESFYTRWTLHWPNPQALKKRWSRVVLVEGGKKHVPSFYPLHTPADPEIPSEVQDCKAWVEEHWNKLPQGPFQLPQFMILLIVRTQGSEQRPY